jgi:hypothetical protein
MGFLDVPSLFLINIVAMKDPYNKDDQDGLASTDKVKRTDISAWTALFPQTLERGVRKSRSNAGIFAYSLFMSLNYTSRWLGLR